MEKLDVKLLKKLADACRKAGIKTFKGYGFEFTLDAVPPRESKKAKQNHGVQHEDIPTDELTEEQLLYYSVGGNGVHQGES